MICSQLLESMRVIIRGDNGIFCTRFDDKVAEGGAAVPEPEIRGRRRLAPRGAQQG